MEEINYYTIKSAMKEWKSLIGIYTKKSNNEIENSYEIHDRIRKDIEEYVGRDKVRENNVKIISMIHNLEVYLLDIINQKNRVCITENHTINLLNNEELYFKKIADNPVYIKRNFTKDIELQFYKYDYKAKKEFLHCSDRKDVVDIKKLIGGILGYQDRNIQKKYSFDWLLTGLEKTIKNINEKQIVNILEVLNYSQSNEIKNDIINEIFLHDIYESEDISAVAVLLKYYPEASIYFDNHFNKTSMEESEEFSNLFTEVRTTYEKKILNREIACSSTVIRNQRI